MNYASIEKTIKLIEKEIKEAKLPIIRLKLERLLVKIKNKWRPRPPRIAVGTCPECDGDGKVFCYSAQGQLLFDENGEVLEMRCPKCHGMRILYGNR